MQAKEPKIWNPKFGLAMIKSEQILAIRNISEMSVRKCNQKQHQHHFGEGIDNDIGAILLQEAPSSSNDLAHTAS